MKTKSPKRGTIKITEYQLLRWNAIRDRAGLEPLDKEIAEQVLSSVSPQTVQEILDRIGDAQGAAGE